MLVRSTTAHRWRSSEKITWPQHEKEQIQRPGTTFSNFSDKVEVPRGHEKCRRFATLYLSEHQRIDRKVVDFRIRGEAGVMAELRNVVRKKKTEVEVLPVVDLSAESAFFISFCGRCNTASDKFFQNLTSPKKIGTPLEIAVYSTSYIVATPDRPTALPTAIRLESSSTLTCTKRRDAVHHSPFTKAHKKSTRQVDDSYEYHACCASFY